MILEKIFVSAFWEFLTDLTHYCQDGGFSTLASHGETSEEIQIAILHWIRMLQTRRHHLCSHLSREYHSIILKVCFTPNDSVTVTVTVTLTGSSTFHLFEGHCDGQNGLNTHFVHQLNVCYGDDEGVAWFERAFKMHFTLCTECVYLRERPQ